MDPQAYVAHHGDVRNKLSTALGWRDMVGRGSGEASSWSCRGNGAVYVQARRRSCDNRSADPTTSTTLPSDDNVNNYTFCVELNGQWFLQKGKMIAYYGQIDFNGVGHGRAGPARRHAASIRRCTPRDWVVAEGSGKMLLADRAFDVNSYDLEDGNLTIRSGNLLAFQPSLSLKQSIIPGFLTLIGTRQVRRRVQRPGVFVEPPDPGGPAGPGGLGGLPLALPPLRPQLHDGRDWAASAR